ncbi:MAG: DEAD/DEAH box helicase [Actinomycetota bacterium]|nr:DEAD/DEAH box helicase [Actinomycetota bacterium]
MTEDRPEVTFVELGIDDRLLRVLRDVGYETPSPIQAETIPLLLEGKDVVGLAQTGTGKTAAFALPILGRIDPSRKDTQALVLAPTRELALQVAEAFVRYASNIPGLNILPIYGGQNYGVQLAGLKRGAHIVVGTPGRVIDHLDKGSLKLGALEYLVLDEADEMLKMGFQEDVERILADTPEYKQVALFSATMPSAIRRISKQYMHDPIEILVKTKTVTAANTRQRWLSVSQGQKLDALTRILEVETSDGMIIFVRTKQATEELAEKLRARGYNAAAINGDLAQQQRERTINQLKSGKLDLLVATDVAARGLDVDRISHVINYDIPHDSEAYVHRIGRTGRAGRTGEALLFVTPRERRLLSSIEKTTRQPLTEMPLPSVEDVNAQRATRFAETITASLGSSQFHQFRGLIEEYHRENEVAMNDIAAALAVMSQEDKEFFLSPEDPKRERARAAERTRDRETRDNGPRERRSSEGFATYRLLVGKRHKVGPGSIVGAIANEGGLRRADFGNISIRGDHSLVELPQDLPQSVFDKLKSTRISGQLIHIALDDGPPAERRERSTRKSDPKPKYGDKDRKPRHR